MEYALIAATALLASALTFFTGFGLGTLLLPAFALCLPVRTAIVLTATVHVVNNIFKLALVGRSADRVVTVRFGAPAVLAAYGGARVLGWLGGQAPLFAYAFAGRNFEVTPIKIAVAVLMVTFALLEISAGWNRLTVSPRYLPLGGVLSGFVGGVSGHQGALRSIFLLRAGLGKEAFVGTGAAISFFVDLSRLLVYQSWFSLVDIQQNSAAWGVGAASALAGTFAGGRLLGNVTLRFIQTAVAALLVTAAAALAAGII